LGDEQGYQPVDKPARESWWKTILFSLAYMIPLFWLWDRTGFPDSLGIHISAHGKTGVLEDWYYSYLLIERHTVLDIVTFLYMCAVVVGFAAWATLSWLKKRQVTETPAPSLNTPSIFDAEEADERRRKTLMFLAMSMGFGVLLVAILYFKGA